VESDVYHRASMEWLAGQVDRGATVVSPILALPEIAGAVARRTSQKSLGIRATEMVLRLPNIRLVPLDLRLSRLAADIASRLRVRGADAVYVGLAKALNIPLLTWDREQMERARPEIDVITPDVVP
jgi:predicted nucleic acid-binding protein